MCDTYAPYQQLANNNAAMSLSSAAFHPTRDYMLLYDSISADYRATI